MIYADIALVSKIHVSLTLILMRYILSRKYINICLNVTSYNSIILIGHLSSLKYLFFCIKNIWYKYWGFHELRINPKTFRNIRRRVNTTWISK